MIQFDYINLKWIINKQIYLNKVVGNKLKKPNKKVKTARDRKRERETKIK